MGRGWKGGVQFTSNLGPRWTGSYHDKEGFQVSKREWKGNKGEVKTRDYAIIVLLNVLLIVYIYITII
jgi:hypothetical protein